jgi:phosphonatase-like hydrolase
VVQLLRLSPYLLCFHSAAISVPSLPLCLRLSFHPRKFENALMGAIKLVLFDITGTIIKDKGDMVRAFSMALKKNGISVDEGELREWRGAAKREVIRHFAARQIGGKTEIAGRRIDQIYDDFRSMLEAEFESHPIVPVGGAENTFAWLREHGILIGTTTGYHRKLSDILLNRLGWLDKFQVTVCSDEVALGRPAPYMIFRAMEATGVTSVAQVVTVGDTPLDLKAGANAGVRGIVGVLSGAHAAERLHKEPHTHILNSVAELPAVIDEYVSPNQASITV